MPELPDHWPRCVCGKKYWEEYIEPDRRDYRPWEEDDKPLNGEYNRRTTCEIIDLLISDGKLEIEHKNVIISVLDYNIKAIDSIITDLNSFMYINNPILYSIQLKKRTSDLKYLIKRLNKKD
jgi:hypothetical protein